VRETRGLNFNVISEFNGVLAAPAFHELLAPEVLVNVLFTGS